MYNDIIFDIDGTLIDTKEASLSSLQQTLIEIEGIHRTMEELDFIFGIPGTSSLPQLNVTKVSQCIARWGELFATKHHAMPVFSQIEELLIALTKKGVRLGIVTSKNQKEFESDFLSYPIAQYFSFKICADDTILHKPNPEPLLKYCETTGSTPQSSLYIGDTIYDYNCAASANIKFVLAGWSTSPPTNFKPDFYMKSPLDLLTLL